MRRTGKAIPSGDLDERLQRALQENKKLKGERNELEEKLTRVQTQFKRLLADLRQQGSSVGASIEVDPPQRPTTSSVGLPRLARASVSHGAPAAPVPSTPVWSAAKRHVSTDVTPAPIPVEVSHMTTELANTQAALLQAREELRALRAAAITREGERAVVAVPPAVVGRETAAPNTLLVEALQRQLVDLTHERDLHLRESREAHEALQALQTSRGQEHATSQHTLASLSTKVGSAEAAIEQLDSQHRAAIAELTKERDALAFRLRLLKVEHDGDAQHSSTADPMALLRLQADVREKSTELTLLGSKLELAQSQAYSLKEECGRLVAELEHSHKATAGVHRQMLQLEQERGVMQARVAAVEETEAMLVRKTEETVRLEQELLKMVTSLQSCNRETEEAVRRENTARVRELQEMRDQADAQSRERQRALLECQRHLAESKRRVEGLEEELVMQRRELALSQKERSDLSAQLTFAGHAAKDLDDDDVHRALAVAAMMKRRGSVHAPSDMPLMSGEADEASKALELYETLSWDDVWEQGQLREALASATLDLELAGTRCTQMADQIKQQREALHNISEERDTLFEENAELRRRVSHVQTVFAKQQLQAYRAAVLEREAGGDGGLSGFINFSIRAMSVEADRITAALGIDDVSAPIAVFFSLDGLEDYDTMLSPTLHSLLEPVDVHFRYDGLDPQRVTLAVIHRTVFVFQLHRVQGTSSTLVAMAELPGLVLLASREMAIEESLNLIDGEGRRVGSLMVEMCCSRLMLPALLAQPLSRTALMSATELRAAMVALRAVRYLRVQVLRAQGLASAHVRGEEKPPQPYVFYTAQSSPQGTLGCIRDTVVRPSTLALTTSPVFDADPVDHRVVVDSELMNYLVSTTLVFVVFDDQAKDIQSNLGVAEIPLRPLLASPQAVVRTTEQLHPQGTLTVGLCWVSGP